MQAFGDTRDNPWGQTELQTSTSSCACIEAKGIKITICFTLGSKINDPPVCYELRTYQIFVFRKTVVLICCVIMYACSPYLDKSYHQYKVLSFVGRCFTNLFDFACNLVPYYRPSCDPRHSPSHPSNSNGAKAYIATNLINIERTLVLSLLETCALLRAWGFAEDQISGTRQRQSLLRASPTSLRQSLALGKEASNTGSRQICSQQIWPVGSQRPRPSR